MAWLDFYFGMDDIRNFIRRHCTLIIYRDFPELCRDLISRVIEENRKNVKIRKIAEIYRKTERLWFEHFYIHTQELTPESKKIIKDLSEEMLDVRKNIIQVLFSPQRRKEVEVSFSFSPVVLDKYLDCLEPLREKDEIWIEGICVEKKLKRNCEVYDAYDTIFNEEKAIAKVITSKEKRKKFMKFCELGRKLLFYQVSYKKISWWEKYVKRINEYNEKILKKLDNVFLVERVIKTLNANGFLEE